MGLKTADKFYSSPGVSMNYWGTWNLGGGGLLNNNSSFEKSFYNLYTGTWLKYFYTNLIIYSSEILRLCVLLLLFFYFIRKTIFQYNIKKENYLGRGSNFFFTEDAKHTQKSPQNCAPARSPQIPLHSNGPATEFNWWCRFRGSPIWPIGWVGA